MITSITFFIFYPTSWITFFQDWTFIITIILYFLSIEEIYKWAKIGKRSELSDILAILFFFFLIFFFSKDILTSIMGAFSIYLWLAVIELKEYPVINKILIISLVTYNVIFIAGLFSSYLGQPIILNTAFSFSFWIILGLGFILFGRKYLVIWRFMSPEYLTLFLYILAWLAVAFINQYTPINFVEEKALLFTPFNFIDFFMSIYFILIIVNWIIYFISGPILDKMLGIKRIEDKNLLDLVNTVKNDIGIKGNVKVGVGKYPILNAMAYGSIFDKRIAIIAEDPDELPEDEIKGIVAHELAHTRGKHTLILTLITSIDLIFRMFFGIPATFYDYTFGNPQIPFLMFIILNFGIYIILYIFVRILEGKADLKAKKAGYSRELVKALYNLESFYATGREIGLNTMLLCEEKITDYNKIINYADTADYLNKSIIAPSRLSLLSNIINSHPPTYHRIAAILDNKLKPAKESLLPFICLRKSKRQKYAEVFESSRIAFKEIANKKFKGYFQIDNISNFMNELKRKEIYKLDLNKEFLFKNKENDELIVGKLIDVKFRDDVCDTDQFILYDLINEKELSLDSSIFTKKSLSLNGNYYLKKYGILNLDKVELNEDRKDGKLIFNDRNGDIIIKKISKLKLPRPINTLENVKDQDVFFKLKGTMRIFKCSDVMISPNFEDSEITLTNFEGESSIHKIKDLIIKPNEIYLQIRKSKTSRKSELDIINWLKSKQLRTFIYLKKPVNNLEIGYIQNIEAKFERTKKQADNALIEKESYLLVENIFNKQIKIPYKILELLSSKYETITIQKKSDTSIFSKFGYILMKKFKPENIFYIDKI